MATTAVEKELIELERRFWQAIRDEDIDAAVELADEPCILTGAQGVGVIDRKTYAEMARSANWKLHSFELGQPEVRLVRDDVGVVAYKIHEDLTVDGKPVSLDAAEASTWVRRDGKWVCALHTESITGDPFGRDRRAG